MEKYIEIPKISELLHDEFMEPLGLSAYRVAKDIKVPVSRIQEILQDKRKITADTDARLCHYFGMSKGYFLRIQMDLDMLEVQASKALQEDLAQIPCITKPLVLKD